MKQYHVHLGFYLPNFSLYASNAHRKYRCGCMNVLILYSLSRKGPQENTLYDLVCMLGR